MARCPDCQKFVSLEMQDPELENDLEVDASDLDDVVITGTVHVVRACAECGTEMKEAALDVEEHVPDISYETLAPHTVRNAVTGAIEMKDGHELLIDEDGIDPIEKAGGRYKKSYYGASVNYTLRCSCQPAGTEPLTRGTIEAEVAASEMDDMV